MIPIFTVDAFTGEKFKGNPAGVCLLEAPAEPGWMQCIAREMNLSETAFLNPENQAGQPGYRLRWFTPAAEVRLCGHATLASAHILWETGRLAPEQQARFFTLSGVLTAVKLGAEIELNFPATPPTTVEAPTGLAEALGVNPLAVGRSRDDYLVEVETSEMVAAIQPDFGALKELPVRGVIVTSRGQGGFDMVSRFFAPAVGINEDPVTGSAHCCLGPFWAERLGKNELRAYQASARGGELVVIMDGERVRLRGQAVTVMKGEFLP